MDRQRVVALLAGVALALATAALAETWKADNGNGTYTNPLFFDEFSDPDLIRVGSDFYLTGTTMHSMPGLPVLRSRDLVNWTFVSYALDRLDLGPSFRLEDGKNEYGRGIWAPCFRYYDGTYYIFSNVNGQTTQLFRAADPAGPWTRTPMKRSLHDLSVLFDDDGKVHVVWGYQDIRIAQLSEDLTDLVPGTERQLIAPAAGMGEGLHFYKINGRYFITSAWYMDVMRLPVARADRLEGPWEVNQNVSRGEDFGLGVGHRLGPREAPFRINPPDTSQPGRCALHQGGIVQTPTGEWWGFSMFDANAVGRLTALSPVTWSEGWPYFGLPGNPGRSPRTWIKPRTGASEPLHAPYQRSDDFSADWLQPLWQWNHVPVDGKWSLRERPGFLRLHALPAPDLWHARNTLTQRAIGPRSTVTVALDASGLKPGDVAGLALFNRPYAWIGVERGDEGLTLAQFDDANGKISRALLKDTRVWLRADCDFVENTATFHYSTDGATYAVLGEPHIMAYGLVTFQGVRNSLFSYSTRSEADGGHADFDAIEVDEEPRPAIPYGKRIELLVRGGAAPLTFDKAATFVVADRGLGRAALEADGGHLSVGQDRVMSLRRGAPGDAETFQWIETFDGDLILMSLTTHRYLRVEPGGRVLADSPGPRPDGQDGVRLRWREVPRPFVSPIFGDHMVLQRGRPNPIWGWSQPGDSVRVEVRGRAATATADADGRWQARIQPPAPGGPYTLKITGRQTVELHDVLVGDVWICAGQSNMQFGLAQARNGAQEIKSANHPEIRYYTVGQLVSYTRAEVPRGAWKVVSPATLGGRPFGGISAVPYFFARKVRESVNVPIGLIQAAVGGVPAETFASAESLRPLEDFDAGLAEVERRGQKGGPEYGNYIMHWYDEYDVGSQNGSWADPGLDDSSWKAVKIPGRFEELGVADVPSLIWLRKEITLPENLPPGPARLLLGSVEKMDTTYVNGRQVGAGSWVENPRAYFAGGALAPGRNVIAIRLFKLKPAGGFLNPAADLRLVLGDGTAIPLAGEWKGRVAVDGRPPQSLPIAFENLPSMPGVLYRGMIAPLAPLALTGVLWYQGESNTVRAHQYRSLLPALISGWRKAFGQGDFPFYIVSLPRYLHHRDVPGDDDWAELREAQALAAKSVPHSCLAVTIDTGDPDNIHPPDKQEVGDRLAYCALAEHYGLEVRASGPTLASVERLPGALKLHFDHSDGGLVVKGDRLGELSLAGDDRKFHWADARIQGDAVIVSTASVPDPKAVRYAWQANPVATLFNAAGLPAAPFRTDDWPGITEKQPSH